MQSKPRRGRPPKNSKNAPKTAVRSRGRPKGSRNIVEPLEWEPGTLITDGESFSRYLKYVWQRSDMSIASFTQRSGLSGPTLYALMDPNREHNPTLKVLISVAYGLGLTLPELFSGKTRIQAMEDLTDLNPVKKGKGD